MPKLQWPAVGACVALAAIGVQLFLNMHEHFGIAVMVSAFVSLCLYFRYEQRSRQSALRLSAWLIETAQYGTRYIQNATDHDITGEGDVSRLVERHDCWVDVIRDRAALYLNPSDADLLQMLHTYDEKNLQGRLGAEHQRIRDWTAERVDRLKAIARRLDDGVATLKRHYP